MTTQRDDIDEIVDWQLTNPPDKRRLCRACRATWAGGYTCPECGTLA